MKILKKGFTIAELLLCITIIGIVSAMGMTITKHNVNKAYQSYWQTGYNNLYDAIAQTAQDFPDGNISRAHVIQTCNHVFRDTRYNENDINRQIIRASNGIEYNFENRPSRGDDFVIDMTIPQPKTRSNPQGTATTRFAYAATGQGYLVPINGPDATYVNLSNSPLLQFYLDNGIDGRKVNTGANAGRAIQNSRNGFRNMTFAEVYCRSADIRNSDFRPDTMYFPDNFVTRNGSQVAIASSQVVIFPAGSVPNCAGITQENRILKLAKPKF